MSLTPYELRFNILQMALNHLADTHNQTASKLSYMPEDWGTKQRLEELQYPTMEQAITLAETINVFVGKDERRVIQIDPDNLRGMDKERAEKFIFDALARKGLAFEKVSLPKFGRNVANGEADQPNDDDRA